MNLRETMIIGGFPGVKDTKPFKKYERKGKIYLEIDSEDFSWVKDKNGNDTKEINPEFPTNYVNHIKDNIGKFDIIFVNDNEVISAALMEADLFAFPVFPDNGLPSVIACFLKN